MRPFIRSYSTVSSVYLRQKSSTSSFTSEMQGYGVDNATNRGDGQSVSRRRGGPGRGRGRGGSKKNTHEMQNGSISLETTVINSRPRPKLTHFLSVPLGHLPAVRSAAESFVSALFAHTPPIAGLDPTIIVSARRLHLTLGVMSLREDTSPVRAGALQEGQTSKTVSSALALLGSLRPRIHNALGDHPLRVPLTAIDIMKPERNDATRAHILFAGPSEEDLRSEDGERLRHVCELVNTEFTNAGFVVDEKRPLKLHCTLINTSHRKPRPKGGSARRIPFSFAEICNLDAVRALAPVGVSVAMETGSQRTNVFSPGLDETVMATVDSTCRSSMETPETSRKGAGKKALDYAVAADLGTHTVTEIQICQMGSWGAEGEYVCVGKIELY